MTSPPQKKSSIENANNLLDELLKLSEELNEPLNYMASINDLEKMKLSAKLMTKIEAYIYRPGSEDKKLSLQIDDMVFYLYFKGVHNQYDIAILKSTKMESGKEREPQMFVVYKSSSQGLWRLAIQGIHGIKEYYEKLLDYVQTTLIHMELQLFLEKEFYNPENIIAKKIIDIQLGNIPGILLANYGHLKLPGLHLVQTETKSVYEVYIEYIETFIQELERVYKYVINKEKQVLEKQDAYLKAIEQNPKSKNPITEKELVDKFNENTIMYNDFHKNVVSESIDALANKFLDNDKQILLEELDYERQYDGIGTYIFNLLKLIDYDYLSKPQLFFYKFGKDRMSYVISDKYYQFLDMIEQILEMYPEDEFTDLHTLFISIRDDLKQFYLKMEANSEKLNQYDMLEKLIWVVNTLMSGLFDYVKLDEEPATMTSKKLKKYIQYQDGKWKTSFRKKTKLPVENIESASNSDNPDDPESETFKLVHNLQVSRYKIKIKRGMPLSETEFKIYYGHFTKGKHGEKHFNFPICIYSNNTKINKWGLPDKYISTGIYSGKPYDYIDQVCHKPGKIQYVRIADGYTYLFCGDIYNKFWPGTQFQLGGRIITTTRNTWPIPVRKHKTHKHNKPYKKHKTRKNLKKHFNK